MGINPYTTVTSESIESAWQIVVTQIPKRDSALQIELSKQQYHNQLRYHITLSYYNSYYLFTFISTKLQ